MKQAPLCRFGPGSDFTRDYTPVPWSDRWRRRILLDVAVLFLIFALSIAKTGF